MPEGNNVIQTNIALTEADSKMLKKMMDDDFIDNRSLFIRRLIRQEWVRRYSSAPLTEKQPETSQV